jgi:hypothetical protein
MKPELTAKEIVLQAEINGRFAAHIPSQVNQLSVTSPSYILKEYEDTIDLNHPVAKQARTSYLQAVKTYQAAISSHAQELNTYYKGNHIWKEMPAPPTPPQIYKQYFKVCKEQYDIVESSARAYAAALEAKPSSELPKKPEPVFTSSDESTLIRCSTNEAFELQIQLAKDNLIESHIQTIVHPSLRMVYDLKRMHRFPIKHDFGKPPPPPRGYGPRKRVILHYKQVYGFSSDSDDEAKPASMDTSDDTNKRKSNDTVKTTTGTDPTDTVEPPAKC